jgi:hypothetical protein
MAITQHTVGLNTANVGVWSGTNVIYQLERAFTWLGFNAAPITGLAVGFSSYYGGGMITTSNTLIDYNTYYWYDVPTTATSGIGTGCTLDITRYRGNITSFNVNRPGVGYTGGETLVVSADIIGGSTNGAQDFVFKPAVESTVANAVSYAVTFSNYYDAVGEDRNGAVVGIAKTITIKVGDTLNITNNQTSSSYPINICTRLTQDGAEWNAVGAADTNRVFNVFNQYNTTPGQVTSWRPLPGQEGVYKIKTNSTSYSNMWFDIVVQPTDPANITSVGYGSSSEFLVKSTDKIVPDSTFAVSGTMRHTIQSGKKYGDTYRTLLFEYDDHDRFYMTAGNGYFPTSSSSNTNYLGGHGYPYRYSGMRYRDISRDIFDTYNSTVYQRHQQTSPSIRSGSYGSEYYWLRTGGNTAFQLDLNIFRSSLDPNFAVLSFKAPTKSSTHLTDNTYSTFIIHNFTTDIWDLDQLYLGGYTSVHPEVGTNVNPFLYFVTSIAGMLDSPASNYYGYNAMTSCAEVGYSGFNHDDADGASVPSSHTIIDRYGSITHENGYIDATVSRIYYRDSSLKIKGLGMDSSTDFNAVVKGIPLNKKMVPCPYYMPDDFVLIDFNYGAPNANIQQGDTISISGSEVYTVITASYNSSNATGSGRTRGIAFCARTV